MLWLYDIKNNFILICDPHALMEPIIKEPSPPCYLLWELGKEAVTSQREIINLYLSRIFYMFLNNST